MKKLMFAALAACVLLAGCTNNGGSSADSAQSGSSSAQSEAQKTAKTPAERTAALLEAVDFPEMAEVTSDKLLSYYGIDEADVAEYSAYVAGAGVYPDEFGVFTAVDADAAERIHDLLFARLDKQEAIYKDYSPDETYKYSGSFVTVTGNSVAYCVCADNTSGMDILSD